VTVNDLPQLPLEAIQTWSGESAGNLYQSCLELWARDPAGSELLLPLRDDARWKLAKLYVNQLRQAARERRPPPAPPFAADEVMAKRIEAARSAVEHLAQHLSQQQIAAKQKAATVAERVAAKRAPAEVESVRGEHHTLLVGVQAATDELAAAREALELLEKQAASPERQALLHQLQVATDAASGEHFSVSCGADLERLRAIGAELVQLRRRMLDRVSDGHSQHVRAKQLADQLEMPRPSDLPVVETDGARAMMRRAVVDGVIAGGGRPNDFEFLHIDG